MSNMGISTNTIRKKDDYSNLECSIRDDADKERQTPGPQGGSHKTMETMCDRRQENGAWRKGWNTAEMLQYRMCTQLQKLIK